LPIEALGENAYAGAMRYFVFLSLGLALAFGQQSSTSTVVTYDVNGHPVTGPQTRVTRTASGFQRTETVVNINGRMVPIQSVEERVVSEGGGTRVVERMVRRYDPNGNPGPPERVRIEEQKRPDGSLNVQTSVFRADLNGNQQLAERSQAEIRKEGSVTRETVTTERPTANGSMEVVERRNSTTRESNGAANQEALIYRRDLNGGFSVVARETVERAERNGQTIENAARYEATNGSLQLVQQTVSRTTKVPGSAGETQEIEVYTSSQPGRADAGAGTARYLKEQRLVERRPGSGNSVVESVSVRRPSDADPSRLGPYQKVQETVCTGKCNGK
jgi:hypothetical protein